MWGQIRETVGNNPKKKGTTRKLNINIQGFECDTKNSNFMCKNDFPVAVGRWSPYSCYLKKKNKVTKVVRLKHFI